MAQLIAQCAVKLRRPRVAPKRFRTVGIMYGGRCADVVGLATLAMQRKPNGRRKTAPMMRKEIPNLRAFDAVVRRGPHFDPSLVAPIKPVGHDPMFRRNATGRQIRLRRTRDAGKMRRKLRDLSPGRQRPQMPHGGHIFFTQGGYRKQNNRFGHENRFFLTAVVLATFQDLGLYGIHRKSLQRHLHTHKKLHKEIAALMPDDNPRKLWHVSRAFGKLR